MGVWQVWIFSSLAPSLLVSGDLLHSDILSCSQGILENICLCPPSLLLSPQRNSGIDNSWRQQASQQKLIVLTRHQVVCLFWLLGRGSAYPLFTSWGFHYCVTGEGKKKDNYIQKRKTWHWEKTILFLEQSCVFSWWGGMWVEERKVNLSSFASHIFSPYLQVFLASILQLKYSRVVKTIPLHCQLPNFLSLPRCLADACTFVTCPK